MDAWPPHAASRSVRRDPDRPDRLRRPGVRGAHQFGVAGEIRLAGASTRPLPRDHHPALEDLSTPDTPGLLLARPRQRGTRSAADTRRTGTWPAPALRASRRTTGQGRSSGREARPARPPGSNGGATPDSSSRSPFSFDLVDRLVDSLSSAGETEPRRAKNKAADPGVRVPRPRGKPVVCLRPVYLEVEHRGLPVRWASIDGHVPAKAPTWTH